MIVKKEIISHFATINSDGKLLQKTHPTLQRKNTVFTCLPIYKYLEKMSDRKRLGLSLEKDGGYSKLIVFMSAVLSGFTFGLPGFLGALTVEVRFENF